MGILVKDSGPLTTIQDEGRFGYQQYGVTPSGPMDARAFHIANILVGNPQGEGAMEITFKGPELEFDQDIVIAVTGGDMQPTVNGKKITCMGHHGDINLKNAMMKSCNIYFADLAIALGKKNMTKTANSMGFNRNFKFDRIETKKSVYDVQNADNYNLGWSGVGQYNDLLNPMHSAILMGAIANSGTAVLPHVVMDIFADNEVKTKSYLENTSTETLLTEAVANKLKEMMRYNVTANYGDSLFPGLNVCAKTGTAEVGEDKEPHGWMVGFSSNETSPLAFSVIVENSGYGSKTAGPIASKVMNLAAKKLN